MLLNSCCENSSTTSLFTGPFGVLTVLHFMTGFAFIGGRLIFLCSLKCPTSSADSEKCSDSSEEESQISPSHLLGSQSTPTLATIV
ncbi:hypothetical protein GDO78_001642 [Eleutherodactylus coqui]|uniref:Uncharacterized protein n=1 Tax=Eleutherodactylus coqui TaxID=57060 RepID=A0A8J6FTL6_ELECQ|nr:hypothetical protein GDO78_001642 [Eleutherodactylus coqui]